MTWLKIDDNTPQDREIMLYLGSPEGSDRPIGIVIGKYVDNDYFTGWAEKSVAGHPNTGLPVNLITHWKEIGDEIPGTE